MPAQPQSGAKTNLEIDRAAHTIRFRRVFDAPKAELFEAWTRPEHVTWWWDAAGGPLTTCEIDLRPGGAFRFVTKGQPDQPFAGTYREISPPDQLVFDAMDATGRVIFHEAAGKTHMTVEIECRSAEHLDQFVRVGVDVGTSQTLDNLVAYAGRSAAANAR